MWSYLLTHPAEVIGILKALTGLIQKLEDQVQRAEALKRVRSALDAAVASKGDTSAIEALLGSRPSAPTRMPDSPS